MTKSKWTAGRDALGDFAPEFARYNDDVLFGEVWENGALGPKERSMLTVAALAATGTFDSSFAFHLEKAKENGMTGAEISATLTHLAFYVGWPKAWAAFRVAKETWAGETVAGETPPGSAFPRGDPNDAYASCFTGRSYLKMLSTEGVAAAHVTFEPGCRNWWHVHHEGGQILFATHGRGFYRERGKKAVELRPGSVVNVKPEIEHWHGAAKDGWFSHVTIEVPAAGSSTEWIEPVTDEEYGTIA
ncbi:MAG: carboxymuconolactone decarboxylase family protein [Deltaproteobacteria bacterium]|jgi:alkylhydroperoxidase/carboxymuconolactone decarboxylase family protein YurZ/quercetin dioxygenase-like cupin family protein|nr:carboxymuconolactone decarboxylase family protein [Deltaproteobacteria bacterium]